MNTSTTPERLKYLMETRRLKQVDILRAALPYAQELGIKLNRSDISQYVSGKVIPGQDKLLVLGKALNVNPVWLMGVDVPMTEHEYADSTPESERPYVRIPVVGEIVAGLPTEAIEDAIDWEEIPSDQARRGDYIGLRVKGNSMEPRICAGDTVIIRRQDTIENGELAVVFVNGDEATLKRVKLVDGGIMLIAFNQDVYEPHFYSEKMISELPVKIYGKVVELRGKF